ncbi:hypothetical protein J3U21_05360 [Gilliamella sp. B2776]|nr:hypothetical protein [Gilliamella sp. B2779]MCX8653688.1 hypothetical protein [Gilliamella sp. B2737]MCX8656121.1 hypothetical protein [Gilliamella sp. B2894]MCX8691574.1 hypothetical protein [Gilliamella sp. B2776]MCX8693374.1 hypothetical protein [Gilliamella sp. B2881]MCX8695764.1 hypothetical protein [Gilliamella sp. B2828]MCX8700190.1 hypothetical protein [Gilliamella sp. B2840]MCX8702732.1 hypothetical protein [Gilliamella sp. B2781]WDM19543.1 hypothetical protein J4T76_04170 [Gill
MGDIAIGKQANLVLLNANNQLLATIVNGKIVYRTSVDVNDILI